MCLSVGKMLYVINRFKIVIFIIVSILILILPSISFSSVLGAPEIAGYSVTPRSGEPDDEFLFLVSYNNANNEAPKYIRLVVDDRRYELNAVNLGDNVYSDGKDYMIKTKLSKGTHIYYFEAADSEGNTSSSATTIQIKEQDEFTHLDVAYSLLIATVIVIIPVVYGIVLLRRLTHSVERLVSVNRGKGKKKR